MFNHKQMLVAPETILELLEFLLISLKNFNQVFLDLGKNNNVSFLCRCYKSKTTDSPIYLYNICLPMS